MVLGVVVTSTTSNCCAKSEDTAVLLGFSPNRLCHAPRWWSIISHFERQLLVQRAKFSRIVARLAITDGSFMLPIQESKIAPFTLQEGEVLLNAHTSLTIHGGCEADQNYIYPQVFITPLAPGLAKTVLSGFQMVRITT